MTKFLNTCAVVLAITGLSARDSAAQGDPSPGDNTGIKSQNAYLSYMPWESINPYGGSVVLQFVDFVLPGNAGMDVRWQRTFNSNVTGGWRFGLTGFPMRIEDPGVGQGTPVFFTIDGAARTTKPVNENDANVVFSVTEAWQYDRTTHLLLLPNGWRVEYGIDNGPQHSARFPTRVYDLFQNELTLTYESPAILYTMPIMRLVGVHQTGPHGVDRQVTIHYDGHDRVSSVEALGRTWTYHYDPSSDPFATWYMSVLSKVDLPDGTSWEYSTANIPKTVTTPLGGQVSYTFEVRQIGEAERFVLTARDTGGRNVNAASGHWAFDYESRGDGSISATTITSPSNVVKYTFNGPFSEPLEATPTAIEVRDLANNVVETESFTYGNVHQDWT